LVMLGVEEICVDDFAGCRAERVDVPGAEKVLNCTFNRFASRPMDTRCPRRFQLGIEKCEASLVITVAAASGR